MENINDNLIIKSIAMQSTVLDHVEKAQANHAKAMEEKSKVDSLAVELHKIKDPNSREYSKILNELNMANTNWNNWNNLSKTELEKVVKASENFQKELLNEEVPAEVLNDIELSSPKKNSSILFYDLLENFESYNAIGQLAISLLLFNYIIMSSLISIVFIFFGDYWINRLNLEVRFPKLAKIIALRRKFQKYYLILNISYIAIAVITETVLCIYILTL